LMLKSVERWFDARAILTDDKFIDRT
jgi:hypothetical protein